MAEPAFSEQPPEQAVVQAGSGSAPATHGPGSIDDPSPGDRDDAPGSGRPLGDADQDLHSEVAQLRRAMKTRPHIDKSMGVLMAAYSLSEDDAWKILVTVSQHTNIKLYAVAEGIVASTQENVLDVRLRRAIEAALKDLKSR